VPVQIRELIARHPELASLFAWFDFGDGVAGTVGFEQILRLSLELVEVRPVRPLTA
jgi:hypothetical protein